MYKRFRTGALLAALAGCSTIPPNTVELNVDSTPQAAVVYSPSGKMLGLTPFTLRYQLTQADINAGYIRGGTLTAVWYSGARATTNGDVRLNGLTSGTVEFKFERPMSAPGALQDVEFAENRSRRQAAESAAAWEALANAIATRNRLSAAPLSYTPPSLASPQRSTANWTGGIRRITTVTYQPGVDCEYNFAGRIFWRTFVGGSCPSSVEVQ